MPQATRVNKNSSDEYSPFLGTSSVICELRELALRVLSSDSPVLIEGETGTGKGVLANWIHKHGTRSDAPFLDLNCAGLSRDFLETELFGHERGAFTGAINAKLGLLETADGGTVFLDEIGDVDIQVQPKLLKVLEGGKFRRLGDIHDRKVDVRLISATNRDLLESVRQYTFRRDLYYRINIVKLRIPSLRERPEDIPFLAQQLLDRAAVSSGREHITLSDATLRALQSHDWPGNIRELRNVIERAVLLSRNDDIQPPDLQFHSASPSQAAVLPKLRLGLMTLKELEQKYIAMVLGYENGSVARTARRLGVPRSSLYNKLKRLETSSAPAVEPIFE